MKHKRPVVSAIIFLVVGLLMAVITSSINRYVRLPDLVSGTLVGFGIGIELLAALKLIKLARMKQTNVPG